MVDHDVNIAIIGAGLSGLSTSYHLGHPDDAVIFEAKQHYGGHVHSEYRDGFTWDDGPHISFTSNEYIKHLFAQSVDDAYEDLDIKAVNYFRGNWIDHPAQTSLWQVPEPLRSRCVQSFLETAGREHAPPRNYEEWLHQAMGPVFADTFPAAYTRKYWTTEPRNMDVDWIGLRVLRPEISEVVEGAKGPLPKSMYYVNTRSARYPSKAGFFSYCHRLAEGADIRYGMRLAAVDLGRRELRFEDGTTVTYRHLVSTIPLPMLIAASTDVPDDVREATSRLRSTRFYRIDVAVNHPSRREELWYYIYDEDKLCVRLSVTERFAPEQRPRRQDRHPGRGLRLRRSSRSRPIRRRSRRASSASSSKWGWSTRRRRSSRRIARWCRPVRFSTTSSGARSCARSTTSSTGTASSRVGRYAEWKYLMTDACVLGGRRAARQLRGEDDDVDWTGVAITDDDVPQPESARASGRSAATMKVVIFCGGMGLRLREHTEQIPKPMVSIGYRPILWHVMRYYAHYGHTDFILCLGYKADVIKDYFLSYNETLTNDFILEKGGGQVTLLRSDIDDWRITFVDTGLTANIGQRLKAVEPFLEDDEVFLANYADVLTDAPLPDMIRQFENSHAIGQMLIVQPNYTFHIIDADDDGGVRAINNVRDAAMWINGGYFVFRREIFDFIRSGRRARPRTVRASHGG